MYPTHSPAVSMQESPFSFHEVLDPRRFQLGFALTFLASMGLLVAGGSSVSLVSLLGAATLLCLAGQLNEGSRQLLQVASRNGERLQRLVADLLHTAQTDAGTMHVVRERADLASVVRDSVENARPAAEAVGLELTLEAPDEVWAVVDSQRMTQVVDNLVSNAIKYTQWGSVDVVLAIEDRVQLDVSDTGIGIDAMDREHLFTRFFRAQHSLDQSIQGIGLGLGLSIIKSIVESHGGRIEVQSAARHRQGEVDRRPGQLSHQKMPAVRSSQSRSRSDSPTMSA